MVGENFEITITEMTKNVKFINPENIEISLDKWQKIIENCTPQHTNIFVG